MMRRPYPAGRRSWRILTVFLFLGSGIAGCIDDGDDPGSDDSPSWGTSERSWTFAVGEPWVVYSHGCGFCGSDGDVPEFRLTALYRDGRVVVVDYSHGLDNKTSANVERIGLTPYADLMQNLFTKVRAYAEYRDDLGRDQPVTVLGVTTATLQRSDLLDVKPEMTDALQDARPPKGGIDATDCGPDVVESFGEPSAERAQIGCGPWDAGWQDVVDIMRDVEEWGLQNGNPTVGGTRGAIVPALGHEAGVPSGGPILAALHIQTCGGLAHGCSGVSALLLFEDGSIVAVWGSTWKPGDSGRTFCAAYEESIRDINKTLGTEWSVPCAEDWNLTQGRGGSLPSTSLDAIRTRLANLDDLHVAAQRQETPCCDRVFTTARLANGAAETYFVQEGSDITASDLEKAEWSDLYLQLRDLMMWLRPSLDDALYSPP